MKMLNLKMNFVFLLFFPLLCLSNPNWQKTLDKLNSSQAVVVSSTSGVQSEVRIYKKENGTWSETAKYKGVIGQAGFADAGKKKEGDKKTPTGIFSFTTAWGYNSKCETKMPYRQVNDEDKFIDDVNSPEYNHWVHGTTNAKSFELMKRKDNLYELGLVIDYNTNPVEKGKGSAIFMHIWQSDKKGTLGCVAISKENMIELLKWLDPKKNPKIILNP